MRLLGFALFVVVLIATLSVFSGCASDPKIENADSLCVHITRPWGETHISYVRSGATAAGSGKNCEVMP